MNRDQSEMFKSVVQVLAILGQTALFSVVAHKAFLDITALAQQHSGGDFWAALVRHILRNLPGG